MTTTTTATTDAETERYLKGNQLDRSLETQELARSLASKLSQFGGTATDAASNKSFHEQIIIGRGINEQGVFVTDQVQDAISNFRQQQLDKLNESTHRLQHVFGEVDRMANKLAAFTKYVGMVQKRMREIKAAKEKQFPRYKKVRLCTS